MRRLGVLTSPWQIRGTCCMSFPPQTLNCGQFLAVRRRSSQCKNLTWQNHLLHQYHRLFLSSLMTFLLQLMVSWPVSRGEPLLSLFRRMVTPSSLLQVRLCPSRHPLPAKHWFGRTRTPASFHGPSGIYRFAQGSPPAQGLSTGPNLQNTFSDQGISHPTHTPTPLACSDLQLYHHILSIVLADLGKSELLVRDTPNPWSFLEFVSGSSRSSQRLGPWMLTRIYRNWPILSRSLMIPIHHHPIRCWHTCTLHSSKLISWRRWWPNRWVISAHWWLSGTLAS